MADSESVDLATLALRLGVAEMTVQRWMRRYPDFPVIERGGKGRAYKFDVAACRAFMAAKQDDDRASKHGEGSGEDLTPQQRLQLARAQKVEQELALSDGTLLRADDVQAALDDALLDLGKWLDALPVTIGKPLALPDAVIREMEQRIALARRKLVTKLGEATGIKLMQHAG